MKKRLVCIAMTVFMLAALCVPAFAANRSWESAYTEAILNDTDEWGAGVQLVDLDIDGTPELLIGSFPGSGLFSYIVSAYTFKNGSIQKLDTGSEEMTELSTGVGSYRDGGAYALYRNNSTGAWRIEGGGVARAGAGNSEVYICDYKLDNGKISITTRFTESMTNGVTSYYVGSTKVSASAYDQIVKSRNDGWSYISSYACAEAWNNGKMTRADAEKLISEYKDGPALSVTSTHKVAVDDVLVPIAAYNINGSNYFKLRDLASVLNGKSCRFSLGWDGTAKRITMTTGGVYQPVGGECASLDGLSRFGTPTDAALYIDGVLTDLTAYNIDGNNYYKLTDVADAIGCSYKWDDSARTVRLFTSAA